MRTHLLLLSGLLGALLAAHPVHAQDAKKPNIVFVLSDDHRHDALGLAGHPLLKTPNLDRLGKEGAWLRQCAVVCPLCAPSRATFLTGQYGHTSGVRTNNGPWPKDFPPSFLSVAHDAGYKTAFIGKKHIYNTDEPLPGIDRWVSFVNQGLFVDPDANIDGKRQKLKGANGDLLTDFAVDFIKENKSKPFAMVVAYKEAHSQQTAPPRFDKLFADAKITLPDSFSEDKAQKPAYFVLTQNVPDSGFAEPAMMAPPPEGMKREDLAVKKIKNYYRCIAALDDYVGRIWKALDEAGQLKNTIFVFAGDNGYFLGEHGRFEKMTPHEESVRIPFLMHYPPAIKGGVVSDALAFNIDLAPTLYDLAGLKAPAKLDGKSLRPVLAAKDQKEADKTFRAEQYIEWQGIEGAIAPKTEGFIGGDKPVKPGPAAIPTWRALRTPTTKYAVYFNGDLAEYYDLTKDPKEAKNLINDKSQKEQIGKLHARLVKLAEETKDPLRESLPKEPSYKKKEGK